MQSRIVKITTTVNTFAMKWDEIVGNIGTTQYRDRIKALKAEGLDVASIEATVDRTVCNLKQNNSRSLVLFGEPQSGKTKMMIALNARLDLLP